jgi:CRP/FNR family transcriptional regulator, cyclic AMP receptor protein
MSAPFAIVRGRVVPMVQRPRGAVEPLPLLVLRPGQTPVRQGEACSGLWVVESGLLRASVVSADGRELALDLLLPGDAVGEPAGSASPCTVRALRPTRLRVAGRDAVPALLSARCRRLADLAGHLAWLDVAGRIQGRLDDLAARAGRPLPDGGTGVSIRLTQDEIASLAGTSRETANRALHRLMRHGAITAEGPGRYAVHRRLRLVDGADTQPVGVASPPCRMTKLQDGQ